MLRHLLLQLHRIPQTAQKTVGVESSSNDGNAKENTTYIKSSDLRNCDYFLQSLSHLV